MAPAAGARARSLRWPGAVGLAVSILLLWWTLHDVVLLDVFRQVRDARLLPFLAAAVVGFFQETIDRLVHHCVILELNIPSYRVEQAKKKQQSEEPPSEGR